MNKDIQSQIHLDSESLVKIQLMVLALFFFTICLCRVYMYVTCKQVPVEAG